MVKLQRQLSQEHFSAECFGLVMDAYTSTCIDALINAFDLSQHKIVVDLEGMYVIGRNCILLRCGDC